jgi:hypothetical protein
MDATSIVTTAYAVFETVDECGRQGKLIGIFTNMGDANTSAAGKGWYGGHGAIELRRVIKNSIGNECYLLDSTVFHTVKMNVNFDEEQKLTRRRALDKLSDAEKAALGLANEI